MARVMVIAGGDWQCPIVKTAKKMGHQVVCSNLYEKSPAFAYADFGEVADVLDKETNLKIAKKYMPDAVLTDQSDIAVTTVAYIAEKLGLKGIGEDKAKLFTNKYEMRKFCEEKGFPYPKYKLCSSYEEALKFFSESIEGPAIIKPIDSQSSRGIHIVHTAEELWGNYQDALKYSNAMQAILVEEYINGKEFTVDGIKTSAGYWVTAISKKNHFAYNPSVAQELLFSNYDEEYDYDALRRINKEMVLKMGMPFGLTHAEYKYMNGKFYLIEIAARGGGTKISSDIVPIMSGVNTNEVYINLLLDKEQEIKISYDKDIYAVLGFFDFKPGKVKAIKGIEKVKKYVGVKDIAINVKPGEYVEYAKDDRSRVGHYILWASGYERLRKLEAEIKSTIEIIYEGER